MHSRPLGTASIALLLVGCGGRGTPFSPVPVACADFGDAPPADFIRLARGSEGVAPPTHWPEPYGVERGEPEAEPMWGRFSHARNDPRKPSLEEVQAFVEHLREQTGAPTRILSHPSQLEVGSSANQVLMNLRFEHSLIAAVIGPGWDPNDDTPALVVAGLPGTASNHGSLIGLGWSRRLVTYPGIAATEDASVVALFSNVGGAESQGQHPAVMDDVACAIAWAGTNLGADTERVLFTGKSRGGGTALAWGANPRAHDYGVHGIFAHTPPWDHSHLIDGPIELYPEIGFLAAERSGMPDAVYWSNDPTPLDLAQRYYEIHSPEGTSESVAAHTHRAHLDDLRGVPRISVGLGTHDQQVIYSDGVQLMQDFQDAGIEAHIEIGVRAGHWDQDGTWEQFDAALRDLVGLESNLFDPSSTRLLHPQVGDRATPVQSQDPSAPHPWVGLVPHLLEAGAPASIVVCGPGGQLVVEGAIAVDREVPVGCERLQFTAPEEGPITWSFVVDGRSVLPEDTVHGGPIQTLVTEERLPLSAHVADPGDTRVAGFALGGG